MSGARRGSTDGRGCCGATQPGACRLSTGLAFITEAQPATSTRPAVAARIVEQPIPQITVTVPVVRAPAPVADAARAAQVDTP